MRFYEGLEPGISGGLNALLKSNPNKTYVDTLKALAAVDAYDASARYDTGRSKLNDDMLMARSELPGLLSNTELPEGIAPELMSVLMRLNDDQGLTDYTESLGDLKSQNIQGRAAGMVQGNDMDAVAALNSIAAGIQVPDQYGVADGTQFNKFTGDYQTTPVGQADILNKSHIANSGILWNLNNIDNPIDARPYSMNADGMILNQGTGNADSLAAQQAPYLAGRDLNIPNNVVDVLEGFQETGQWPNVPPYAEGTPLVDPAMQQQYNQAVSRYTQGPTTADPTTNAKKAAELRAMYPNLPDDIINGVAYGTFDWRAGQFGLEGILINTLTGEEVGRVDSSGQFTQSPGAYQGGGGGSPPPGGGNVPSVEGQIYHNPTTGQRGMIQNGKWVLIK